MPDAQLSGNGTGAAGEMKGGPLSWRAEHLQLFPGNAVLNARAEGFGASLFRGEARGEALCECGFGAAIGDLLVGKDALQKAVAVAFDGVRDARYFDEVDSRAHQHEATVAQEKSLTAGGEKAGVMEPGGASDGGSVHDFDEPTEPAKGWDLHLTAICPEEAARTVRFLTGAVMACGGYVLSRRFDAGESAAIEFAFVRATCVEMYSILIAAGLELCAQSHLAMAALCQCTRETLEATAGDSVRVELTIRRSGMVPTCREGGPAAPPQAA